MIIFDGAFGTYYIEKTNDLTPCEKANLTNPGMVLAIHKEYISVGVTAIKTNTFGANSENYSTSEIFDIISAGYNLAVSAANGTDTLVFADIGGAEGADTYFETAEIFIKLGAENFLFETLQDFDTIKPAIELIVKKVENPKIIVSFAVSQEGYSGKGFYYKNLIAEASENENIFAVGLNCVCGPSHILELIKDLGVFKKPISVMPNNGYASIVNGRRVFRNNIEYFSDKWQELSNVGVSILGGCCGTTPEHIRAALNPVISPKIEKTVKKYERNNKKLKLKPISVELDPPMNNDVSFLIKAADKLKKCGVSMITLSDSPLSKCRADSVLTAAYLKNKANIEVLPHLTCRDKNYIALKGSLIGASFNDIDKILVITGDPVSFSLNNRRAAVFQFNSVELAAYIANLNKEIFSEKPFQVYGAININASNFDAELAKCRRKIESGISILYSQPIFSDSAVRNLKTAKEELSCKIYAGILPVASYKNAIFLNNEVSGIEIPADVIESFKVKENVIDTSIAFSKSIIERVYDFCDGFYIMTPLKKVELVTKLIEECFDV